VIATARRSVTADPPAFQWDAGRGRGPKVVRLFGSLGERELLHVIAAVQERGRCPQDFVCLDFEQVTHLDYRELPAFARALTRQASTGSDVCLVGMSAYIRALFGVAGQGPAMRRMEYRPVEETETSRRPPLGIARIAPHHPAPRRDLLR
jgi:ABC-type transporter Mla MlaB component